MPAFLYSTGPAMVYVDTTGEMLWPDGSLKPGTPTFLGTFQKKPTIAITKYFAPVHADVGGGPEGGPLDRLYLGQEAAVYGVINNFNYQVMRQLMATPLRPGFPGFGIGFPNNLPPDVRAQEGPWGTDGANTYGTLMTKGKRTYFLWVVFPRSQMPENRQIGMVGGYRFVSAFLSTPHELQPGSGAMPMAVRFECLRRYVSSGPSQSLPDELVCYDHVLTDNIAALSPL